MIWIYNEQQVYEISVPNEVSICLSRSSREAEAMSGVDCELFGGKTDLSVIQAEACAGSNIRSITHSSCVESESEGLLGSWG